MKLIDGHGSARVVMCMLQNHLRLRRAVPEDMNLLWRWANDNQVRKNAFSQKSIEFDTHTKWFSEKLESDNCSMFIGINAEDIPVGQVRFDIAGNSAEVDISVDHSFRNKGLGVELLRMGVTRLFLESPIEKVSATVKTDNISSRKMFEGAGFFCNGETEVKGCRVHSFTVHRNKVQRKEGSYD